MKGLYFLLITFLASMASAQGLDESVNFEPCGIELERISKKAGYPGDVFVMYGKWGSSQGEKLPGINKVMSHELEVVSWSDAKIVVRIPDDLESGVYKVGVYCNDPSDPEKGGSYGTHWVKFKVH